MPLINALTIAAPDSGEPMASLSLDTDKPQELERLAAGRAPLALVVRIPDKGSLLAMRDLVEEAGQRQPGKELARYLLKDKFGKAPLLEARYQPPGHQVPRSIRTLLAKAKKSGLAKLFIIAVTEEVFFHLAAKAAPAVAGADETQDASRGEAACSTLTIMAPMEGESALEDKFLGVSRHDAKVRRLIMYAAFSPDPVLILGETGSGKEVAARLIHQSNPDMLPRPMKSLNCAGLPHDLFESELFGYVKGAFTGAIRDKMGLWEAAGHGTLFLDEIGDMPLSQQAKVLRALREKTIRRLGDTKDRPVHARIIAATNRDIPAMIAAGQFRQDLYYRLRGFLIRTPALRAHPENIPHLARRLWRQDDHDHLEPLSPEVLESLQRYGWPGNVGELQRFLRALHSHFPKVKHLDGRHVATLARLLGMGEGSLARPAQPSSKEDMDLHRARCLGHLKHAEDALVALRLTTDKILEAASLGAPLERPRQELARNAAELAALCEPAERIYFHGEHARDLVCALCEKVFGFSCGLAGESTASLAAWAATAGPQLDKAATVVMREIGAVLKQG